VRDVELWNVDPRRWSLEQRFSSRSSYLHVTCWVNLIHRAYVYSSRNSFITREM